MRKLAGDAQHLDLGIAVEAVARLDLDGGDTLGQQVVEPLQGRGGEVRLGGRPGGAHGGGDAAARLGDVGIGHTCQPLLEFIGAASAMDDVGVAVDQPGRGEAALAVEGLMACRGLPPGPRPGDPAALDQHRRILDQAIAILHRGGLEIGEQHGGSLLYKVVYTV